MQLEAPWSHVVTASSPTQSAWQHGVQLAIALRLNHVHHSLQSPPLDDQATSLARATIHFLRCYPSETGLQQITIHHVCMTKFHTSQSYGAVIRSLFNK
jgi:hypothetical protein